MKSFKTLLSASALTLALSSISMANHVSTTGQNSPSPVTASGSLAKYVNFTTDDTSINLRNFGGPTFNGFVESSASEANSGATSAAPMGPGGSNPLNDSATIEWDANTHLAVTLKYGYAMTSALPGVHQDAIVPTWHRTRVKGSSVKQDNASGAVLSTDNVNYNVGGLIQAGADFNAVQPQQTLFFGHGAGNGIKLDVQVKREGVNDHYGSYSTGVTDLIYVDAN